MPSPNDETKTPVKAPYQEPTLTEYGRLEDLTTGGTGSAMEPSTGKRPRP